MVKDGQTYPDQGGRMEPDEEPMDYQAAAQSGADYIKTASPYKQPGKGRKVLLIAIVVLLVVGLASGGWYFYNKHKTNDKAKKATQSSQQATPITKHTITDETKNYISPEFFLSFDYPADWTITDTTGSGILTAKSIPVTLMNATSQAITAQVTLTFRNKTQKLTEFDNGNAVASRDSDKISYLKPTPSQRGQTYISYLQYATSTSGDVIDGIYITGDFGYKKGQAIPKVDITKVDPVISITFGKCVDEKCTNTTPVSISADSWNDKSLSDPLNNMLKSLSIS